MKSQERLLNDGRFAHEQVGLAFGLLDVSHQPSVTDDFFAVGHFNANQPSCSSSTKSGPAQQTEAAHGTEFVLPGEAGVVGAGTNASADRVMVEPHERVWVMRRMPSRRNMAFAQNGAEQEYDQPERHSSKQVPAKLRH